MLDLLFRSNDLCPLNWLRRVAWGWQQMMTDSFIFLLCHAAVRSIGNQKWTITDPISSTCSPWDWSCHWSLSSFPTPVFCESSRRSVPFPLPFPISFRFQRVSTRYRRLLMMIPNCNCCERQTISLWIKQPNILFKLLIIRRQINRHSSDDVKRLFRVCHWNSKCSPHHFRTYYSI